jgi:HSP90 family molecular chaperone
MEKCADLLPDYFGFVSGLVDSSDLSLNISRELLQHDRQLKTIAVTLKKRIKSELKKLMDTDREKYETFYKSFRLPIKYGLYSDTAPTRTFCPTSCFPQRGAEQARFPQGIRGCDEGRAAAFYFATPKRWSGR